MNRAFSLKKNKEFNYVYRTGKNHGAKFAVMIVSRARHRTVKVGFAVNKKVGNAVKRNLVKRRMREAFRDLMPNIRSGHSMIFVARPNAYLMDYQTIRNSMEKALRKARLFDEKDCG